MHCSIVTKVQFRAVSGKVKPPGVHLGLWRKVALIWQSKSTLYMTYRFQLDPRPMIMLTTLAYLTLITPVCILKGDVKGAYRHLMTYADHVYRMAASIQELHAKV
ncbi:hypothetical protein PHMEG_0009266 [Phytophthora megakarya]|uniref:Uncharacterized protein n=1 Tax=Phytophthora megakarya TaxID=4795 RepID=A0A225WIE3_9STRA|nr:hypothetical protein PHMEG_0009266 [Phytophthora megakarya]